MLWAPIYLAVGVALMFVFADALSKSLWWQALFTLGLAGFVLQVAVARFIDWRAGSKDAAKGRLYARLMQVFLLVGAIGLAGILVGG